MAATLEAQRLTEAHRLAQSKLGVLTVQRMVDAWPLLDPENLDGTFARWTRAVVPVVNAQRAVSTTMAANYITTFRTLELGAGAARFAPVLADILVAEHLATSMLVTGPVAIKTAMARGAQLATAVDTAQAQSARAAMRHVLNGGRETVTNTVAADRRALGWARTTSGKPCYRCALYASRGPVYRTEKSSSFESHDGCSCGAEPVYRDDAKWPTGSNRYAELYAEAKSADGDTAKNFRRLIEAG